MAEAKGAASGFGHGTPVVLGQSGLRSNFAIWECADTGVNLNMTIPILLGYRGFFSRVIRVAKHGKCFGCYNFPGM